MSNAPRVALIHALRDSLVPIWDAFDAVWPDANTFNLLDDSLSADLAEEGALTQNIIDRFLTLGRYASETGVGDDTTKAILFTCSAFGKAIEAVKTELTIPVFTPNEAAFDQALAIGGRIGLVVSFLPSQSALTDELQARADAQGRPLELKSIVAEGALSALQAGDGDRHDDLIAKAAATLTDVDSIVLGQFSMARAAHKTSQHVDPPVITTPTAAVACLRDLMKS